MCGIAGIFSYSVEASDVDEVELSRIRDSMAARGPDGFGIWLSSDRRVGLAHRRLAVIDLSENGAQPMFSVDGKTVITFNGEIYNYKALREQLAARGYIFRSHSDTEVLLALYAMKGEAMVNDLRGMFAFAIWDLEKGGLFLARDPYGIKPLYYADDGKEFVFASQVKALLTSARIPHDSDPAGWIGFYLFGNVPDPFTTYSAVRALEAGSTLWIDSLGARSPKHYYSIAAVYCDAEQQPLLLKAERLQNYLREILLDSVNHHLVADVPVGIFLSGGIDSGTLLSLMWELGHKNSQAITIAFEEFRGEQNDESRVAKHVAGCYGASHTIRMVSEQEFHGDLAPILASMDQPTIDGVNSWFASKAAKELGLKVVISGLGGDELFEGYPSFKDIPNWMRIARLLAQLPFAKQILDRFVAKLNKSSVLVNPKLSELINYGQSYEGAYLLRRGVFMAAEIDTFMDGDFVTEGLDRLQIFDYLAQILTPRPMSAVAKIAVLEASLYMRNQLLRDTDWASMAHGVEVRVPFVDAQLLRRLAPVLAGGRVGEWKKRLACSSRLPLPEMLINRSKTGFETPTSIWIQRDTRVSHWKRYRRLVRHGTPWARRWACEVAAAQGNAQNGFNK